MRSEQAQREWKHKEQLIQQAKAEYAKKKQPAEAAKSDSKAGRMFLRRRSTFPEGRSDMYGYEPDG